MTIESAIIGFIVMCACFLAANISLYPYRSGQRRSQERRRRAMEEEMLELLRGRAKGPDAAREAAYLKRLYGKLRRPPMLIAYEEAAGRVWEGLSPGDAQWYADLVTPVFARLCPVYERKPAIMMTGFIYVLSRLLRHSGEPPYRIWEFLYVRLRSESLVCRQNALAAIYAAGEAGHAVKAILYMNRAYKEYNSKLITEGLVRFNGDMEELAGRLWEVYGQLTDHFKLAALNFLRLVSGRYSHEMLAILRDESADDELRYAAIRYLGKYPCAAAKPLLLQLVEEGSKGGWTYAAVSALALSAYPGEDTFDALKRALFRPDWYVRLNASASLERLGIDYLKLSDVINSSDRYAREIVQYRLEEARRRAA